MADLHNVFISHYGEDEKPLDTLKQRLREHNCNARNSSVGKKKYRPYRVTDATIARYLRICIRWAKTFIVMTGKHNPITQDERIALISKILVCEDLAHNL